MKTNVLHFFKKVLLTVLSLSFVLFSSTLSAQTILTIGTGTTTNTSTAYPAPYGNYYYGAKHQFIIPASEITAIGGAAGTINSIAFDVATVNGVALNNFTIKMGQVSQAALTTAFIPNLTQVYTTTAYTEVAGWNTHTFTTPFVWDGVSSLIVETSFGNSAYTSNAGVRYSVLSYNSSIYYRADASYNYATASGVSSVKRPNMQVGITMVPQTDDLALLSWESPMSPVSPSATMPITVKVHNTGIAMIDTFNISYSIDGGTTFVVEAYNDSISAGDTLTYTFTANANMPMGVYNCIAAVSNVGDTMNMNDTLTYQVFSGNPLNGTYTIGTGATDDFSSLDIACTALENFGVTGSVIFNVAAETFNEQVSLDGPINGMSPLNTVTFKGQGASTIITAAPTSANRDIFRINNQSYVTLDSLSFVATATGNYNCGIRIMSSDSVTVRNSFITVPHITSSYTNGILVVNTANSTYGATVANDLVFDNNVIDGGYYSIKLYASNASHSTNIDIEDNELKNFRAYGIYSYYQDSILFKNNNVYDLGNYSSGYGIYMYKNYLGSVVANNNIVSNFTSGGTSLYINSCVGTASNPIMVYNNMLTSAQATSSPYTLYMYYGKYINIYYNTFRVNSGGTNSRAMYLSGSTSSATYGEIKIKNNIIYNNGAGYGIYFNGVYYPNKITEMDYNNIFVADTNKFAKMGSTYTSLAAWQASVAGIDANSVSMDPVFLSTNDAHVASIPMNGLAAPIAGIDSDIDGEARNVATPDMGADEYTPPANEVEILSYLGVSGASCGMTSSELIKVVVRNNGTLAQTNLPVKYSVDGGTAITENITSLASLAIDTFTFAVGADLSAIGMHNIVVYVDITNEENRLNDSVFANVSSIGSISSFPYVQNFDTTVIDFGLEYSSASFVGLDTRASNGNGTKGLILTGGPSSGWSSYSNVTAAFGNTTHVSSATACNVDASSTGPLNMSFDMKMNATYNIKYGWFRVMLNDTVYLKDIDGDSVWHAPASYSGSSPFQELNFNLAAYAGTQFTLSLQAACKYSNANYATANYGDEVFIDNLKIWETAPHDLSATTLLSPVTGICEDAAADVEVVFSNMGLNAENNVPVTAVIVDPNGVSTTLTAVSGNIAVGSTDTITLTSLNTTAYGVYNVKVYATLATDTMYNDNDTLNATFEIFAPFAVDYIETFDGASVEWQATPGWSVNSTHGKNGKGLTKNFYGSNHEGFAYLARKIGPVTAGSALNFDYRVVDYTAYPSTATVLDADSFFFMLSTDCGVNYDTLYVVDSISHTATTNWTHGQIDLAAYVGQKVMIKVQGKHVAGDYYFDVDNFGIATLPTVDLGNDTSICAQTTVTLDAGSGSGYYYMWTANGDTLSTTASTLTTDSAGTYTVELTAPMGVVFDTVVVSVFATTAVTYTGLDTVYCENDMASTLVGAPVGGIFSGTGIVGNDFDPAVAGMGVHTITYTFTDANSCVSAFDSTTLVEEAPMAIVSNDATICEGDSITISASPMVAAPSVFFSMYIEGSSNNKGLEIFNATTDTVDLANYRIAQASNGNGWAYYHTFPVGARLAPNTGWVMVADAVSSQYYDTAMADEVLGYPSLVHFNGDDARAVEVTTDGGTTWTIIDIIGDPDNDPGSAWAVAGVNNATKDHTIIRKSTVVGGSTNWTMIAGTDSISSQYQVLAKNTFTGLGSHTITPPAANTDLYLWSTGETTSSITVKPTSTTVYTVTVSNPINSCVDVDSVEITVNALPVVNLGADQSVKLTFGTVNLDAGNVGADYLWSTGETSQIVTYDGNNLVVGANNISVTVTSNACSASDDIIITGIDDVSIDNAHNNIDVNVYPNPNNGQFDVTVDGITGEFNMQIVNVAGEVVYNERMNVTANFTTSVDVNEFAAGVYYIKLINNDGVTIKKLIIK